MRKLGEAPSLDAEDVYDQYYNSLIFKQMLEKFTFVPYLSTAKNSSEAIDIIRDFIFILQQAVAHAASEAQNELLKQRLFAELIIDDPAQAGESPTLAYWRGQHRFYIEALNGKFPEE